MGKLKWTLDDAPANNDWQGIAYGNGLFVAVAESGTNRIMTSNDGLSWTARPAPVNKYWNGIAYGNGKFVVVGLGGSPWTMSSTDGINWTTGSVVGYTGNGFYNVAYGDGKFVAVSSEGIIVSTDGENWTTTRKVTQDSYWRDVAYGNGLFVVVANYGIYRIITSPDGITWTERHDEVDSFFSNIYNWEGITYGNGLFVVINGNMGTGYNSIITSPDGINWTVVFEEANNIWQSVAYGDGLFVISGYNKTLVSTNGVNWHREFLAEDSLFTSNICYGDEKFVVISAYGYGKIATANWPAPYNFDYGNGTEEDPYEIWTPEDLDGVRDYLGSKTVHFFQKDNIDLNDYENWVPIGKSAVSGVADEFQGVYNGGLFKILNLKIIEPPLKPALTPSGLFGKVSWATLKNILLVNPVINILSNNPAGCLCGSSSYSNFDACGVFNGVVISNPSPKNASAGGLLGSVEFISVISNCFFIGDVSNTSLWTGGLIGSLGASNTETQQVMNCFSCGSVTGRSSIGGLIGESRTHLTTISNCFTTSTIICTSSNPDTAYKGGLIGELFYPNDSIVISSYYDVTISGQTDEDKGTPKTTEEMKQQTTYIGWDFDNVWNINPLVNDGYPFLRGVGFEEPEEKYQFAYGDGTEDNPYEIWTVEDFLGIFDYCYSWDDLGGNMPLIHFKQMANLDFSTYGNWYFDKFGTENLLNIKYSGNGYIINRMTVSIIDKAYDPDQYGGLTIPVVGLFPMILIFDSELHDVHLRDYSITCKNTTPLSISPLGFNFGFVTRCSATGTISVDGGEIVNVSGLLFAGDDAIVSNCYSFCSGDITGFAANNEYWMAGISWSDGPLNIENCYSVFNVGGDGPTTPSVIVIYGVGPHDEYGDIPTSYFDSDKSATTGEGTDGLPRTTAEMKQQSTYEGWDFDTIWDIDPDKNDGYPYLRIEKIDIDIPTSPILELLKDIELLSHRTHLYISEEQKINLATKYGIGSLIVASGIYPETLIELDSLVNSYWEHTTKDIKLKWKQILYTNINGYIKLDNIIINDMFNYLTNEELIIGDLIQLQDNLIIPIPPLPVIEWTPSWVNGLYEELKETDDETLINDGLVEWDWYVTMDDELYKVLKNNPSLDETDEFLEASDVLSLIKKINNTIKPMN